MSREKAVASPREAGAEAAAARRVQAEAEAEVRSAAAKKTVTRLREVRD